MYIFVYTYYIFIYIYIDIFVYIYCILIIYIQFFFAYIYSYIHKNQINKKKHLTYLLGNSIVFSNEIPFLRLLIIGTPKFIISGNPDNSPLINNFFLS